MGVGSWEFRVRGSGIGVQGTGLKNRVIHPGFEKDTLKRELQTKI